MPRVIKAHRVLKDHQDLWDPQDHMVNQARMDYQAFQVTGGNLEHLAYQDSLVLLVL